jgi:hypothetical protein
MLIAVRRREHFDARKVKAAIDNLKPCAVPSPTCTAGYPGWDEVNIRHPDIGG